MIKEKEMDLDVEKICAKLNPENRNYVLAVANALKFAQEKDTTKKIS